MRPRQRQDTPATAPKVEKFTNRVRRLVALRQPAGLHSPNQRGLISRKRRNETS